MRRRLKWCLQFLGGSHHHGSHRQIVHFSTAVIYVVIDVQNHRESNNKTFFISFSHIRVCVCVCVCVYVSIKQQLWKSRFMECAFVFPGCLMLCRHKCKENSFSALSLPRYDVARMCLDDTAGSLCVFHFTSHKDS